MNKQRQLNNPIQQRDQFNNPMTIPEVKQDIKQLDNILMEINRRRRK